MGEYVFNILGAITYQNLIMLVIGCIMIYMAIDKGYEPDLMLPMGFGTILVNLPLSSVINHISGGAEVTGALSMIFDMGIATELLPLLILISVGAMCDFSPLLSNPKMVIFGITAQSGIFLTMGIALLLGYNIYEAGSIGIVGAADGPTPIYVAARFAPHLLGAISVAAYTYMSLVPIIQPPVIYALTTKKERRIKMTYSEKPVSRRAIIIFPIAITAVAGIIAPESVALLGFVMFGNLLRVSGVTERLSKAAQNELANIVTMLLGFSISVSMEGSKFITQNTLKIIVMGLVAFMLDTACGVLSAKIMNIFLPEGKKINPMVGGAGISAFPMSSRVIQRMGLAEDKTNHLLMHAVGANIAGQVCSVIAAGVLVAYLSNIM
ncbi:MAG: sodium ion-translocating decarboxylase subunit beta [Synergistes sp.]|nr:sodium ion-translocating decarboxylase subunit beta [Synergistes sp.]